MRVWETSMNNPEYRRQRKEAQRQANRERWEDHPDNMHARRRPLRQPVPGINFEVEPINGSASLNALREIMADGEVPINRRVDAAEIVLGYELSPAALANADPTVPVSAASFKFLQTAASNAEVPEALRFRCLKLVAQIENARASKVNVGAIANHRHLMITLVNNARRAELIRAGVFHQVIANNEQWSLSSADDFDEPILPQFSYSGRIEQDGRGVGAAMHNLARSDAQSAEQIHQILLSVSAKNRLDDWRRLIRAEAIPTPKKGRL